MWKEKRAATLAVGDVTPLGPVESVEYFGGLRRVALTIGREVFDRGFDDIVSVTESAGLEVGHIWTAVQCPAYRTQVGADCTCGGAR